MNNFTSFQDWNYLFTSNNTDKWVTYEAVSETNQIPDVLPQEIADNEWLLRPRINLYTVVGKRCIDIAASLFVIVFILAWLTPIIALLIYLDSSGPFYFIQIRTGQQGKTFPCLKFRTMTHISVNTEFRQTLKNDSRVTRVGQFLRRTNLDEMLQFINVLLGDMTLVGPRPHAIDHDAIYWTSKAYRARYLVKPGITGLAQTRGARGATTHPQSMSNRVRYDHFYITNQTFMLDMKICLATVVSTLQGDTNAW